MKSFELYLENDQLWADRALTALSKAKDPIPDVEEIVIQNQEFFNDPEHATILIKYLIRTKDIDSTTSMLYIKASTYILRLVELMLIAVIDVGFKSRLYRDKIPIDLHIRLLRYIMRYIRSPDVKQLTPRMIQFLLKYNPIGDSEIEDAITDRLLDKHPSVELVKQYFDASPRYHSDLLSDIIENFQRIAHGDIPYSISDASKREIALELMPDPRASKFTEFIKNHDMFSDIYSIYTKQYKANQPGFDPFTDDRDLNIIMGEF